MTDSAHGLRLRALHLFHRQKARKMPFAQDAGLEEGIWPISGEATGQFGLVKKVCSEGLDKRPNHDSEANAYFPNCTR